MQQPPLPTPTQMMNAPPSPFSTAPVSTVQIQKLLDENKQLILVILENQNLGKLAECAQYQAMLQKNLMYLAAIADAQPQVVLSQTPTQPAPQQGHFMQHPQPMHQVTPGGLLDPSSFSNPPGSRHNESGAFAPDGQGKKQFTGDKQS
uniref:SS18 N-terminal domain-containing protein n=1 Tax=Kalanchoe fedtschenkoi TaxID=63787 RepID=A0A7N0U8Q8_KALFE